jgi:hypothetical protein
MDKNTATLAAEAANATAAAWEAEEYIVVKVRHKKKYPPMPKVSKPAPTPPEVHFYDSNGTLWQTCSADDTGAVAFGPAGCAKTCVKNRGQWNEEPTGPTWKQALAEGLIDFGEEGDFPILKYWGEGPPASVKRPF